MSNTLSHTFSRHHHRTKEYTQKVTPPLTLPPHTSPTLLSHIIYMLYVQVMFVLLKKKNEGKPRNCSGKWVEALNARHWNIITLARNPQLQPQEHSA
ncbi:hypothetical protein K491DRAFT_396501 [Lophiostoma macrostomum CBS 122681]|uniref:Uncharacterized protein n=1 Tax=Lophiostoma macrostomum CBS 122681 TaxID=1314788 RepID=A0A6A6TAB6_9PLEO|nr:hypothetical protein K491DRAFT_396501 [Lophiostoma macrostomum CBS 122681]